MRKFRLIKLGAALVASVLVVGTSGSLSRAQEKILSVHTLGFSRVLSEVLSPNGRLLASGSWDETIKL